MTTANETLTAIAGPTGDIGASFYFHPDTVAAGKELGLDGFRWYVFGRAGVLGDVPAPVVVAAFGYFHPALIDKMWSTSKERCSLGPLAAGQAYFDECGKRGSAAFGDVDGLDAYCEAADVVIEAASRAGLPLFAGIAELTCSDDTAGRAMQKAAVLRELRGSAHLCAVLASGLTDAQAHVIKRPADVETFGYAEVPAVPDDGDARMAEAEQMTDRILEPAFSPLTAEQSAALVAGTEAMAAALTR